MTHETDPQEQQVFEYCVKNRRTESAQYATYHLSDGWSLIQYKAPNFVAPGTPVWAIWNDPSDDEKHCFVVYGDPHAVYMYGGEERERTFFTTAKFILGNGDVVYFSGAAEANGQLSTVHIQRKDIGDGSILIWGQGQPPTAQLTGAITADGLTWTK